MKIKLQNMDIDSPFIQELGRITGEDLAKCYQCGKCTAGCPVSYAMDFGPSQMIRLLQLGREDVAANAESPWICVGCLQCWSRCPKGVSAAAIFEGLRQMILRKGEDREEIGKLPFPFLKAAPQQALVCGFRKLVS